MCLFTISGRAGIRATQQPATSSLETRLSSTAVRGRSSPRKSPVAGSCPTILPVPTRKGLQLSL